MKSLNIKYLFKSINSYSKDLIILLIGYASYAIGQWLFLFILFKNDPYIAGQYSYALAISGPLVTLSYLHLRPLFISDPASIYPFKELLFLRIILIIIFIFIFGLVSFFIDVELYSKIIIFYVGVFRLIEGLNDIVYGVYQKKREIFKMGISLFFRGALPLILISLIILFGNLEYFPLVLFLSTFLVVLLDRKIIIITLKQIYQEKINFNLINNIIKKSFYLGLLGLLMALIPNIPRYFIKFYFGFEKLALFSTISYILIIGTLLSSALSDSIAVKLATIISKRESKTFFYFYNKMIQYSIISLIFVLLMVFIGDKLLSYQNWILIDNDVKEYVYMGLFTVPFLILSNIFMTIIFTFGYLKTQFWLYLVECLLLSGLCALLIPKYGLIGGFISILIMYMFVLVIKYIMIKYFSNRKFYETYS